VQKNKDLIFCGIQKAKKQELSFEYFKNVKKKQEFNFSENFKNVRKTRI